MFLSPTTSRRFSRSTSGGGGGVSLGDYIQTAFPHAGSALVQAISTGATAVGAADSVTPESVVDSLALNTYLWAMLPGQCFTDTSGTVAAVTGDAVRSVRCAKSGALMVAPGAANAATLTASDGLSFLTDDFYDLDSASTTAIRSFTAAEAFIALRNQSDPPVASTQMLWTFGSDVNGDHMPFTTGGFFNAFGSTARKSLGNLAADFSTAFRLLNPQSSSGNWTANVDTTQVFTTSTNVVGWHTALRLGANSLPNAYFNGNIETLILRNAILPSADRSRINKLLKQMFSLTGY